MNQEFLIKNYTPIMIFLTLLSFIFGVLGNHILFYISILLGAVLSVYNLIREFRFTPLLFLGIFTLIFLFIFFDIRFNFFLVVGLFIMSIILTLIGMLIV